MLPEIEALWIECMDAFRQHRTWRRARRLGLGQLACLGRHTVAGLICAGGRQADDWSADYRLFARDKWDADDLFAPAVRGVLHLLPENAPTDRRRTGSGLVASFGGALADTGRRQLRVSFAGGVAGLGDQRTRTRNPHPEVAKRKRLRPGLDAETAATAQE